MFQIARFALHLSTTQVLNNDSAQPALVPYACNWNQAAVLQLSSVVAQCWCFAIELRTAAPSVDSNSRLCVDAVLLLFLYAFILDSVLRNGSCQGYPGEPDLRDWRLVVLLVDILFLGFCISAPVVLSASNFYSL